MSNPVARERKAFRAELRRLLPGKPPTKHSGTIRNDRPKPEKAK